MKKLAKDYINEISQEVKDLINIGYLNQLFMDGEFSQANDEIDKAVKSIIENCNLQKNEIKEIAFWAKEEELENCKNTLKAISYETPSHAYVSIKCRQSVCKEFIEIAKEEKEELAL